MPEFNYKGVCELMRVCLTSWQKPWKWREILKLAKDQFVHHITSNRGTSRNQPPCSQVLIPTGFPQILQRAFFFFFFAALSLHCYMGTFSSCGEQGLLSGCSAQASHCGAFSCCREQALEPRFRNCGSRAQLLRGMWDLSGPGIEPVTPALVGRFLTTGPPGESQKAVFYSVLFWNKLVLCNHSHSFQAFLAELSILLFEFFLFFLYSPTTNPDGFLIWEKPSGSLPSMSTWIRKHLQ